MHLNHIPRRHLRQRKEPAKDIHLLRNRTTIISSEYTFRSVPELSNCMKE